MISFDPKTKKLLKTGLKILGLLLVLCAAVWFLLISPYLTRQEKQRFESASAELEKLSQEVQRMTGNITETHNEQNCGRATLKSESGPLSCSVSTTNSIAKISVDKANEHLRSLSLLSQAPLREGPLAKDTKFVEDESEQTIYQNLGDLEGLTCVRSFYLLKSQVGYSLSVSSSCGGPARAEHYPVEE